MFCFSLTLLKSASGYLVSQEDVLSSVARPSCTGTLARVWMRWSSLRLSPTWMIWSLSTSSTRMLQLKRRVNSTRRRANMMDESGHQSVPWLSNELAQFQPCSELSYKKGSSQQLDLARIPPFAVFQAMPLMRMQFNIWLVNNRFEVLHCRDPSLVKMVDPTLNQTTNESMNHHYINQPIYPNLKFSSYLSSGERYELAQLPARQDLSLPVSLPRYQWILSLEVAEHIPEAQPATIEKKEWKKSFLKSYFTIQYIYIYQDDKTCTSFCEFPVSQKVLWCARLNFFLGGSSVWYSRCTCVSQGWVP